MAATRIIKKYPNRRLYDTEISSYITIEDVRQLILDGEDFEVRDAKSGDDLTRSVLLQIIADQEQDGEPMLSTQLLSQLIRFYGDSCRASWATTWSAACRFSSTSSSSSASRWATCWARPVGDDEPADRAQPGAVAEFQRSMGSGFGGPRPGGTGTGTGTGNKPGEPGTGTGGKTRR